MGVNKEPDTAIGTDLILGCQDKFQSPACHDVLHPRGVDHKNTHKHHRKYITQGLKENKALKIVMKFTLPLIAFAVATAAAVSSPSSVSYSCTVQGG